MWVKFLLLADIGGLAFLQRLQNLITHFNLFHLFLPLLLLVHSSLCCLEMEIAESRDLLWTHHFNILSTMTPMSMNSNNWVKTAQRLKYISSKSSESTEDKQERRLMVNHFCNRKKFIFSNVMGSKFMQIQSNTWEREILYSNVVDALFSKHRKILLAVLPKVTFNFPLNDSQGYLFTQPPRGSEAGEQQALVIRHAQSLPQSHSSPAPTRPSPQKGAEVFWTFVHYYEFWMKNREYF